MPIKITCPLLAQHFCILWNGLQTWQINILTGCSGNSSGLPKSLGRSYAGQKDKDFFISGERFEVLTCTFIFVVSLIITKQRWQFKGKHRLSTASQTLHCASSWFSSPCNCEEFWSLSRSTAAAFWSELVLAQVFLKHLLRRWQFLQPSSLSPKANLWFFAVFSNAQHLPSKKCLSFFEK